MEPAPLQQVDRTYVRSGKGKVSYFAGCDYFRLASHPAVVRAAHEGIEKFGLSVSASRLSTGNHALYRKLENALSAFFESDDALLTGSGYLTNQVVAQALAGDFPRAFIDAKAHPSLQDAARALRCPVEAFKTRDPQDLARLLSQSNEPTLVLTDGLFSQNGEIAPLDEYLRILPPDGMILVDDAHGAGVLGKTGKGTPEHLGVGTKRIIQTLSLSKAFGAYGGAVICGSALRDKIVRCSVSFVGSTPLPLPLANAALQSVKILKTRPALRARLSSNVKYVKRALEEGNIPVPDTPAPIISVVPETAVQAAELRARLDSQRVFPSFIRYPGGPSDGYFRFVLSSEHTRAQLDSLIAALV